MTVRKRPQLWTREVPGGWRVVSIRQGSTINPFYLSPDGKRFGSLEAVKVHIATSKNVLSDTEDDKDGSVKKKRRRKRKRKDSESVTNEPIAKKLKFDDKDLENPPVEAEPLSLPLEIQKRRKLMAAKSPFRNLLKRTLVRNHVRMRGRMLTTLAEESNKRSASSSEDESDEPDTDLPPPNKRPRISEERSATPSPSLSTPPRQSGTRPNLMFTPPNLTPPVVRRSTNLTFSSPNQRSVASRLLKPVKPVYNSPLKTN